RNHARDGVQEEADAARTHVAIGMTALANDSHYRRPRRARCLLSAAFLHFPPKRTIADQLRTFADRTSHIQRPHFAPLPTGIRTSGDQPKRIRPPHQCPTNDPHRLNLSNPLYNLFNITGGIGSETSLGSIF
ncbi:MAG: hypothetical protein K2Y05_04450, partial [Hyphomicrobiaceae bacterium]|nr:hypothetical protein [Hyphomicrobiaceae bacterium]